jgi:phage shock protein C
MHDQSANEQIGEIKSSPDSLFGVCQSVGEDFGFNPFLLRLCFLGLGFFSIPVSIGAYALLGVGVAASRWLFPKVQNGLAVSKMDASETAKHNREPELLAA